MDGNNKVEPISRRYTGILFTIAVFMFFTITGRLIYLQYQYNSETDIDRDLFTLREVPLQSTRGNIYSQEGEILSTSIVHYRMFFDCTIVGDSVFKADVPALSRSLSQLFGNKSAKKYEEDLRNGRKKGNRYMRIGNRAIGYKEREQLYTFPIFKYGRLRGGIIEVTEQKRINPYDELASRTIGKPSKDGTGVGIESTFDIYLKGKDGSRMEERVAKDTWVQSNSGKFVPPEDGYDIYTTINIGLQDAADKALREKLQSDELLEGGTAVVMEVATGAIRAIVNLRKDEDGTFKDIFPYASTETIDPGSTMKLSTLLCLLEDGHVTLDTPIDAGNGKWIYSGFTFTDTKSGGYGMLNVKKAFEKSSNIAFAKLAVNYYENDYDGYIARLHSLKLNERLDLEIDDQRNGYLVSAEIMKNDKTALPNTAIGYSSKLSPLNMLSLYNTVANGGKMMKPYLIEKVADRGKTIEIFGPKQKSGSICSKETIRLATEALIGVVEEGTAQNIKDPRYKIAGKTGTAQITYEKLEGRNAYVDAQGRRRYHASFVGFFPADAPKYSCVVSLYTERTLRNFYGGTWSAPVFKNISDYLYSTDINLSKSIGNSTPTHILSEIDTSSKSRRMMSQKTDSIPNLIGLGLKDALFILENQGYKVTFKGCGKITCQNPEPNSPALKGDKIELTLSEE